MFRLIEVTPDLAGLDDAAFRNRIEQAADQDLSDLEILELNGLLAGRPGLMHDLWMKLQGPVNCATRNTSGPDAQAPAPTPAPAPVTTRAPLAPQPAAPRGAPPAEKGHAHQVKKGHQGHA